MVSPIPESRVYVHQRCGGTTVVSNGPSDGHFSMLSNPFCPVGATFCVRCGTHFDLAEFVWEDTGEGIAAFRSRLKAMAPLKHRLLQTPAGCLMGTVGGAVLGGGIGAIALVGPYWGAAIGVLANLIFFVGFLGPRMDRRMLTEVYGVEDFRQLK